MEEEINYDIMRYDLDENGYITSVFFGCSSGTCFAYEGEVPEGYIDLEDWYEANCNILNAWFISDGNLVYDAARATSLQEIYAEEEDENGLVHRYEIYGLEAKINQNNEALKEQFLKETITNKLIEVDNSKALSPNIKITNVSGSLELIASNKNMLPNEATTQTISGVVFEQNYDRSITLNGTSTEAIEYNIAGSGANTTSIFVFKKDVNYYLSSNGYQIRMYNFDGVEREEVYNGTGGAITFTENRSVTQIVLCVPNASTLTDVTIYPQLELGTSSTNYVMPYAYSLEIDLNDFTNIEYVMVYGNEVYVKTIGNEEEFIDEAYLGMHEGYNVVYALQDVTLELTYYTNVLDYEFEVENLEFMQGKGTKQNQFRILEDGSMEAHNGNFSGTITSSEGDIGGWTIGDTDLSCDIIPPADYTTTDTDRISSILLGDITPTTEDYAKYDLNGDGEIDILDFRICNRLIEYNLKNSIPGKVRLDTSDYLIPIKITNSDNETIAALGVYSSTRDLEVNGVLSVSGEIINHNLDLFNDTVGTDWKEMMKNKLDYCIANIKTSSNYKMSFINGGWSGHNYGFGLFSKIGGIYQLVWFSNTVIRYCRKSSGTYTYYTWYESDTALKTAFPVGSVFTTATNTNPNSLGIPGTWTIIDKDFSNNGGQGALELNTTNTSSENGWWVRDGHTITVDLRWVTKVQLNDNTIVIGKLKKDVLGLNNNLYMGIRATGYTDGGNSILMVQVSDDLTVSVVDLVPDDYVAVGQSCNVTLTFTIPYTRMLDSACKKFHWKRTA